MNCFNTQCLFDFEKPAVHLTALTIGEELYKALYVSATCYKFCMRSEEEEFSRLGLLWKMFRRSRI